MNPCYADWVDNSVAKLTKSFEKKTVWGGYFMLEMGMFTQF